MANILRDSADGLLTLRCNLTNGQIVSIQTHVSSWFFHPTDSSVDVAVVPWSPDFGGQDIQLDLVAIDPDLQFATRAVIADKNIGIGDNLVITGLFSRFVGNERNLAVVRMGSIALMPREPVPTKKFGNVEGFLIEVRSIGGLSGSPVFVLDYGARLSAPGGSGPVVLGGGGIFYLLGLLHGHWETDDQPATSEIFGAEKLNLGIAVVVPAEKIVEVLNHPKLEAFREQVGRDGHAKIPGPN